MSRALIFIAAFVTLVLEAKLTVFGIRPNLAVLLAVCIGLKSEPAEGLLWGITLGLLKDGLSGGALGPTALSMGFIGSLASLMSGLISWKPLLGFLFIPFVTAIEGALSFALSVAVSGAPDTAPNAAALIFSQAALSALGAPFIKARDGG